MFKVVRPVLKRIVEFQQSRRDISKSMAALFFIILFISAYITELIGIHALFGAFLAGVMMPTNMKFRNQLIEKIEYVALIILLPLFFVYTGLRTEIGLLNTTHLWLICGLIITVAITGKFFGSALAARFVGIKWKDSLIIGALMNTRGLMELVVLNIGLDLGILSPEIFAMMVIMALTTTFMTSPSLSLINKLFRKKDFSEIPVSKQKQVLIPFASSQSGKKLLNMANFISKKQQSSIELTMLHATEGNVLNQYNVEDEEKSLFKPIIKEAEELGTEIKTIFDISSHSEKSIVKIANKGEYDFVLIGSRGNFYTDSVVLGGFMRIIRTITSPFNSTRRKNSISPFEDKTRYILSKLDAPVGIFIDRKLKDIQNIFVPLLDDDDAFIGEFIEKNIQGVRITFWDNIELSDNSLDFVKSLKELKKDELNSIEYWDETSLINEKLLRQYDLVIISLRGWKDLKKKNPKLVNTMPSTLILATP